MVKWIFFFCFVSFGGSTSLILSSVGQVSFPKQFPGIAKVFFMTFGVKETLQLLVAGLVMSLQMLQLEYNKTYEELTIILTQNLQTGNVLLLGQSGLW